MHRYGPIMGWVDMVTKTNLLLRTTGMGRKQLKKLPMGDAKLPRKGGPRAFTLFEPKNLPMDDAKHRVPGISNLYYTLASKKKS